MARCYGRSKLHFKPRPVSFLEFTIIRLAVEEGQHKVDAVDTRQSGVRKDVLEETNDIYITKLLQKVPYVSAESVQGILDEAARENAKAREAKPESLINNAILKELEDSGLIKKLYGN